MELKDKVIFLTGGTSGIGLELLKTLGQQNRVIVLGRNINKLEGEIPPASNVDPIACDLSKPGSFDVISNQILENYPEIDVLINNAAVQYTPAFLADDFVPETVDREIAINFGSVCRLTYHLLPSLLKESRSLIMNINSGLALAPKTSSAIYCATKAALNSFSISLGYQLEKTNIKVLQTFMPLVDTPMTQGRGAGKISSADAAQAVIDGLIREQRINDVGKVKVLRSLLRLSPGLALRIMKRG